MRTKQKKGILALAAALVLCLTAALVPMFSGSASAVEILGKRSLSGFGSQDFEVANNKDRAQVAGGIEFIQVTDVQASTAAYTKKLTGMYSVDFFQECALVEGSPHLYLNFGSKTVSEYPEADGEKFYFNNAGIVYNDSYALNVKFGLGLWNTGLFYRFSVNAQGNVDIYCQQTPITDESLVQNTLQLSNADFSKTDGYFLISHGKINDKLVEQYGKAFDITVKDVKIKCEAQEIDAKPDFALGSPSADWSILGDDSKAIFGRRGFSTKDTQSVGTDSVVVDNPLLKSKFSISDEGLAEGEEAFSLSFQMSGACARGSTLRWGLVFGLGTETETVSALDTSVNFGEPGMFVGSQGDSACVYLSGGYNTPVTVTGYKGGKLVAKYKCPHDGGEHVIETTPENPISFNGRIGFGIWGDTVADAEFKVLDFKFSGNTKTPVSVSSVEIDGSNLDKVYQSETVKLSARVNVTPNLPAYCGVDFSIVSGSEFAEIENGSLKAKKPGKVKIKAVSKTDSTVFSEKEFEILSFADVFTFGDSPKLQTLLAGETLAIGASYGSYPDLGFDPAVTLSIVSGETSVVTLDGTNLQAVGKGAFTLRITSVENGNHKDYSGTVYTDRFDYELAEETFADGFDKDVWRTVIPGEGKIVNREQTYDRNGINFVGTKNVGNVNPKLVLKGLPFGRIPDSETVFDVTFTASVAPRSNDTFFVGFLFGMSGESDNFTSTGVGALQVGGTSVKVYEGGAKKEPTFVTQGEPGDIYSYGTEASASFTTQTPITIRIVGRTDGTLELYRGQDYEAPEFYIHTDITKLYATYSGFDFSGYTAFYANNTDPAFVGHIENVTVKGSLLYNNDQAVRGITVNTDLTGLRYAPGMAAIDLSAEVHTVPNSPEKSKWTAEVKSGPASVDNGKLVLSGLGEVTLRFSSVTDPTVFVDKTFTVDEPLGGIRFDQSLLKGLVKGDEISLNAKFFTDPESSADASVAYTVQAGDNFVNVASGKLKAIAAGTVTIRISSVAYPSIYKDYTFEISALERYDYRLSEKFSEIVPETWDVMGSPDSISANGGLNFQNAFNTEGNNSKAVLQLPFTSNPISGVVFDATFTAQPGGRQGAPYGFLFGMSDKTKNFSDPGVGSIQFSDTWMNVYRGGVKLQPNYVTVGSGNEWYGKDNGFAYMCDIPMRVRLVGKSNGTLELYLDMHYADYGVSLDKLFATYGGFDFDGYVGFYSNAEKSFGAYTATIRDVYIAGNYLNDPSKFDIKGIALDETNLTDLLYVKAPLTLGIRVRAFPNLDIYKTYSAEVVSGPAEIKNGNQLYLTGAGTVKLKISSTIDETVFVEKALTVGEFIIDKIVIDTTKLTNVTTDSQPIDLVARMECNTYVARYLTITISVVSGKAEIVGKQLRITGAGKVVIKAASDADPDSYATYEFDVKDNDVQYDQNATVDIEGKVTVGCNTISYEVLGCLSVLLAGAVIKRKF